MHGKMRQVKKNQEKTKHLPDFTSCRVFGTYPDFVTITRIHFINVIKHLRTNVLKQDFLIS